MHVVHVNQDPGIAPGRAKGAAVHLDAMRSAFADAGCRVSAIDEADPAEARERLETLHGAEPVGLVYERYALEAFAAGAFARRHGVPHVLEVNAPLLEEARAHRGRPVAPGEEAREAALFAGATAVLAVSRAVAAYVRARGVPVMRVLVRPNGVDARRFHPLDVGERASRRRLLGVGADDLVLGFHGRLRPWHGFERLSRLVRTALDAGLPARLLIVGEGPFEQHIDGLPRERVTRLGWLPHEEVAGVVGCFDALPLGYGAECAGYFSPLKLHEAMAAGAVPLVPAVGDLPELVRDGESGLVHSAGDERRLFFDVCRLAVEPGLREELGRGARRAALRHSWDSIADDVLALAARQGVA